MGLRGDAYRIRVRKKNLIKSIDEGSIWRRMSIPIIRRRSKAQLSEKSEPLREDDHEDILDAQPNEELISPL